MTNENEQPADISLPLRPPSIGRVLSSVPVLTLALLIATDALLRLGNPVDALGFKSIDVWNLPARIRRCKRSIPDAALLGSSLLMVLCQPNKERHYSSGNFPPYLQDLLRKQVKQDVTCVNLCSGLQMPTEGYLIGQAITDQSDYPRVFICGLTLRDFIDGDFTREWTLTSFQSLAPFVPLNADLLARLGRDTSEQPGQSGWLRILHNQALKELILCHYWFLYRDRTSLQMMLSAIVKDLLENLPLDQSFPRLGPDHQYHPQRYGFLAETWVPRKVEKFTEAMYRLHPELVKHFEITRQASIYARGSEATRTVQIGYLEGLIELCKAKEIKPVIVNMPLSPELFPVIPAGLNEAYREYMRALAEENSLAYIDLFGDPEFTPSEFKDGVHLNYTGGCLLADRVVAYLKEKHPDVLDAMSRHAAERAKNPALKAKGEEPYTLEHLYD